MSEYQYKVQEKSLTQDFLTAWVWNPVVARIPAKITPNTITIIGAGFVMVSGFLVWLAIAQQMPWLFAVAAICIFIYMTCDNVDGPHARRTSQSSRLGEFLDHWFDAVDSTIFNLCMMAMLHLAGWPTMICISLVALSFFATIWEHHHTGVFHSGRFGTNESLLLVIFFYFFIAVFYQSSWVTYQNATTINFASGMVYLGIVVCSGTTLGIIWRVRSHLCEFLPMLAAIAAAMAWFWTGQNDHYWTAFFFLATNLLFTGRLLLTRLTQRQMMYRPWIVIGVSLLAIGLLACSQWIPADYYTFFRYGITGLLGITFVSDLSYAVAKLKSR